MQATWGICSGPLDLENVDPDCEDGLPDYGAILDDGTRLETLDKHTEYVSHL